MGAVINPACPSRKISGSLRRRFFRVLPEAPRKIPGSSRRRFFRVVSEAPPNAWFLPEAPLNAGFYPSPGEGLRAGPAWKHCGDDDFARPPLAPSSSEGFERCCRCYMVILVVVLVVVVVMVVVGRVLGCCCLAVVC